MADPTTQKKGSPHPKRDTRLQHRQATPKIDGSLKITNMTQIREAIPELSDAVLNQLTDHVVTKFIEGQGVVPDKTSDKKVNRTIIKDMADIINTQVSDYDYKHVFSVCNAYLERIFKNYRRSNNLEKPRDSHKPTPTSSKKQQPPASPNSMRPMTGFQPSGSDAESLTTHAPSLPIERMEIQADMVPFQGPKSRCVTLVIDVLQEGAEDTLQRISIDLWKEILKEELEYSDECSITYTSEDCSTNIINNRHFRAALVRSHNRGLRLAKFEIQSVVETPVSSSLQPSDIPKPQSFPSKALPAKMIHRHSKSSSTGSDILPSRSKRQRLGNTSFNETEEAEGFEVGQGTLESQQPMLAVPTAPAKADLNPKTVFDLSDEPEPSFTIGEGNIEKLDRVMDVGKNGEEDEDEDEDGINQLDSEAARQLMDQVDFAPTEHLEPGRWERCCKFFMVDPAIRDTDKTIAIPGMCTPLLQYQALGTFVMLEMENWQGGGWNADDMGLGKARLYSKALRQTIETIACMATSRALELAYIDVKTARSESRFDRHLAANTLLNPQPANAVCPSGNQYGILCPCIRDSPAGLLEPARGPNLVFAPATILPTWLTELIKHLDLEDEVFNWQIRFAHGERKLGALAEKFAEEDRALVSMRNLPKDIVGSPYGQSRLIVVTTRLSYDGHVTKILGLDPRIEKDRDWKRPYVPDTVRWGRLVCDEAHLEVNNIGTVVKFKELGDHSCRKWCLTGTPFESSPAQMKHWVASLAQPWWSQSIPEYKDNKAKTEHRRNLRYCTPESIAALAKVHEDILKPKKNGLGTGAIPLHIKQLSRVLATLWLKRSATKSKWNGHPLTNVPDNKHVNVECPLPKRFLTAVNQPALALAQEAKKRLRTEVVVWQNRGRIGPKPQFKVKGYLADSRKPRTLSSFPALSIVKDTKDMEWTGSEIIANNWYKPVSGHPYELRRSGSVYEKHIHEICEESDCPKTAAIQHLVKQEWGSDEKAVFVTFSPANAFILYWYLRDVLKKKVALVHTPMKTITKHEIVALFQDEEGWSKMNQGIDPPQYLISTARLIGFGWTLHKAKRLVIVDPEWRDSDQEQAKKRINRIGQRFPTTTYLLQSVGSVIEELIYDRANRRMRLINMSLDPANIFERDVKPGGEDEDNVDAGDPD